MDWSGYAQIGGRSVLFIDDVLDEGKTLNHLKIGLFLRGREK